MSEKGRGGGELLRSTHCAPPAATSPFPPPRLPQPPTRFRHRLPRRMLMRKRPRQRPGQLTRRQTRRWHRRAGGQGGGRGDRASRRHRERRCRQGIRVEVRRTVGAKSAAAEKRSARAGTKSAAVTPTPTLMPTLLLRLLIRVPQPTTSSTTMRSHASGRRLRTKAPSSCATIPRTKRRASRRTWGGLGGVGFLISNHPPLNCRDGPMGPPAAPTSSLHSAPLDSPTPRLIDASP